MAAREGLETRSEEDDRGRTEEDGVGDIGGTTRSLYV